jgi:serine/threonine protein kinase
MFSFHPFPSLINSIQLLCEEAKIWSRLQHPNILSFLGIAWNLGLSPAIVTPLCTAGPVAMYIRQGQLGTKERFKMVSFFLAPSMSHEVMVNH